MKGPKRGKETQLSYAKIRWQGDKNFGPYEYSYN